MTGVAIKDLDLPLGWRLASKEDYHMDENQVMACRLTCIVEQHIRCGICSSPRKWSVEPGKGSVAQGLEAFDV